MKEYTEESPQIEPVLSVQDSLSWYWIIIIFLLSILYLYIAIKEYPKWRILRENYFTKVKKNSSSDAKTDSAEQQQNKNPLLYIPFIPFAAIYLFLRLTWDLFRLFVFYSLDSIETGLIKLWHLTRWSIKMIPKICVAIPPLWDTYIQGPIIVILDWIYSDVWPIFKSMMITTWDIGMIICIQGQKFLIHSWNFSVKYSKIGWNEIIFPLLVFMSWIITNFIVEPGKWVVSKAIYLGKITWYCACALAKDLAKDFRDLLCFGWKISEIIYNNALKPTGEFIQFSSIKFYEKCEYYFPIFQKILYNRFVLAATSETSYLVYVICGDPLFRSFAEFIYSIIQSPTLYNFINKHLQLLTPILISRIRQSGLELAEYSFISTMDAIRSAYHTYHTTLLPIIIGIPKFYNEAKLACNKFYRNIKEKVLQILGSLWTIFAPLLRPVILALSFFYTTVILVILLTTLRMSKWAVSMSIIAFSEAFVLVKKVLSILHSKLESIYNVLSPHISSMLQVAKGMMYELFMEINDLMSKYFPSFINSFKVFALRQLQLLKDYTRVSYEKYEPVVLELKERVRVAADEAVIGIGQAMINWVKNERALKDGISLQE
ncbi:6228_t:CDS:1 [Funneliformis geosporum]|uniref:3433_t:CDS:1 n=1 Tax=Funneliformis geosporum TaxID=1117311 RepID=A0A9W4SVV0_9GLOM|nr:3433_t:CDS:1 [Funneliformis geosporum]CAI2187751.1 6228_t:CDS:1 [Funneliformis geosporum]